MKNCCLILIIFSILLLPDKSKYSQMKYTTSMTDVYMGNYGYWDYQSTGSMLTVEQDSMNIQRFSAVYLSADSSLSVPNKRVLYFFSSNQGNSWISGPVGPYTGSYPSLALQLDGRAIIAYNDSLGGLIRVMRNTSAGSLTFDSLIVPLPNSGTDPKILYYNNYLILCDVVSGQIQRTRYNYLIGNWSPWVTIGSGVNNATYQVARGYNGKIAVCWIGDGSLDNVKYVESADSGNTFGASSTIFSPLIAGNDTVKAFSHIDMVYYNNTPAITWDANAGIVPAAGRPGIQKQYRNPRIYFWNLQFGVQLIADSSNYGGVNLPGRNFSLSMGYNYSTLSAPTIGVSYNFGTTNVYICYSAAKTNIPFGNFWYDSDIFTKFSGTGNNWNLLFFSVPVDNVNDDRFASIVKRNYNSFGFNFALTVQKDPFPGSFRAGDTTAITRSWPEFFYVNFSVHTAEENREPYQFDLCQNYPNPFNSTTRIEYFIPIRAHVKIDVYDFMGRYVETVMDGESAAGSTYAIFDGKNLSTGVYFYRMFINGKYFEAQKMVLLK
jgi:hypothetical protein